MRTKEQIKAYRDLYNSKKMWNCSVCNEELKISNKYSHLEKDYHLINVENMIALGLEVPKFKRSAPKDWKCPICKNGIVYKNRSQHCSSLRHIRNKELLSLKGIPTPNIFVNEKFMPNFSRQSIEVKC